MKYFIRYGNDNWKRLQSNCKQFVLKSDMSENYQIYCQNLFS